MKATLMLDQRHVVAENAFVEVVVWRLPAKVPGSRHDFKYRLAFVVNGACVIRFDNEAGKGDHKHIADAESPYTFTTPGALVEDFWSEVGKWRT